MKGMNCTHNIGVYEEISKFIPYLSSIMLLSSLLMSIIPEQSGSRVLEQRTLNREVLDSIPPRVLRCVFEQDTNPRGHMTSF